ncbi:WXG100 family type VII secretion target [Streptomyces sp. NPDC002547]
MPESVDYDVSSIRIDPQALGEAGRNLISLANEMGSSIKRIYDTIADLKLAWVAESADEAQAFSERWSRVMVNMFGEEDGATGALPALAGGILATAIGFSQADELLEQAFISLSNELAVPSGDGSQTPTDHVGSEFPVNQDYPN